MSNAEGGTAVGGAVGLGIIDFINQNVTARWGSLFEQVLLTQLVPHGIDAVALASSNDGGFPLNRKLLLRTTVTTLEMFGVAMAAIIKSQWTTLRLEARWEAVL